ncbi:atypical/ABC1/ABC1-A protein kinase, variant 2 [Coprinopsis cinerea AmutBmut pab1-1]|nr:atypical/ABC1/ABC1-A protein kinase, variant 2 [Coprinopsis cinerea AmutBmut pab1-1]
MPPGPAYNALAVVYSVARIVEHAARHRAAAGARTLGVSEDILTTTRPGPAPQPAPTAPTSSTPSTSTSSDASASTSPSEERVGEASTQTQPKSQLSKAERRRIQAQLEEEEFRAILGKRWVDGVLVDGSLPFSVSHSHPAQIISEAPRDPVPPIPEIPELPTQSQSPAESLESGTKTWVEKEREAEEVARVVEEVSHEIEHERELETKERPIPQVAQKYQSSHQQASSSSATSVPTSNPTAAIEASDPSPTQAASTSPSDLSDSPSCPLPVTTPTPPPKKVLQASKVPSSRIGRLFHYGGLAASLGYGAAAELLRGSDSSNATGNVMLSEANIKRLVGKLTQMRGAALKLGQFMSIQDTHLLPPELDQIFRRVQDSAHYMPDWQMEKVLSAAYGPNWCNPSNPEETVFMEFERIPFAAASIGQVHRARLAPRLCPPELLDQGNKDVGLDVAVKVQFPNIVNSIKSDLGYVKMLLSVGGLLPKGLFLDRTIEVMSAELADECSYTREASFLKKFRAKKFLGGDERFKVPWVWEGSTDQVLVMERVGGVGVGDVSHGSALEEGEVAVDEETVRGLSQRDRNDIAARIIELCLKELFEFRAMQTDPNWTNFLWNQKTRQIELVDFGATRTYSKKFMDSWLRLLQAAASEDRQTCIDESIKIGYLTGQEDEVMLDAHVQSMTLLATPFKETTTQPFAFGPGSRWSEVTKEIREFIPVMVKRRLTPPPKETYSLNRYVWRWDLLFCFVALVWLIWVVFQKIERGVPPRC